MFPLFAFFAIPAMGAFRSSCSDLRFCRDNLNRQPQNLTAWSFRDWQYSFMAPFAAPLFANGRPTNATLLITKIRNSGFRIRVDPGAALSRYRYDIAHDSLVVNATVLNSQDFLIVKDGNGSVSIELEGQENLSLLLSKSPLSISLRQGSREYLAMNSDDFMFVEDGSPVPDVLWDNWTETARHGRTAVGISFRFSGSDTELTGFAESNNGVNLPDVDFERHYALDYYSHYGYVPFVTAHNPAYDVTPAVFWMNPTDTFYRIRRTPTDRTLFLVCEGGFIDFVVFAAPGASVLPQYYRLTRFPFFPPAFTLGYHQCRWGYPSQAHVEQVMANLSAVHFPQDAQWLDIDHLEGSEPFILSRTWWTNATKFFADATAAGRRIIRITDCHMYANTSYFPYTDALSKGYLVSYNSSAFLGRCWPGPVSFPDFLRADVRNWWATLFARYEFPENVHVWNDMNEVATWDDAEGTLPKDATQLNGTTELREVHSLYGFANSAATHAALLSLVPDRRPFVLTRSFFAGSQKYAWHWSGDNEPTYDHLALSLSTLLTSNIAGLPFSGSDIGGFDDETEPSLLARWYQLGAFLYPLCREHSATGLPQREPYIFKDSNPEQFGAMFAAVVARYRLLPLLYTAARDAAEFGQPFVAPLWYYFPKVPINATVSNTQPVVGGKLMVVPQLQENATIVTIVKPPGNWFLLWNGTALVTGAVVPTRWADPVPAYLRGGAITALFTTHGMTVAETFAKNLTLYIALDAGQAATGSLYFDDLVSMQHTKGVFLRVAIECTQAYLSVHHTGNFSAAPFVEKVVIYGAAGVPAFVIPGGKVTFENGIVSITGVWIGLAVNQTFTAPSTPAPTPKDDADHIGIIVGVAVGAVVLVALIAVVVVRCTKSDDDLDKHRLAISDATFTS
jgi:alpha 1,3-glucosidase